MCYNAAMRVSLNVNTNWVNTHVGYHRCTIPVKLGDVTGSVGRSHSSDEVSVMGMERRASVIWSYYF